MPSSAPEDWCARVRDGVRDHFRNRPLPGTEGAPPVSPEGVLSRYEIAGRLGEGAAAVVYRARDRELGRWVALKMLRQPLGGDPVVRERFHREARVAAMLSHPNIVSVYDVGEAEGQFFLVMEVVEGRPLDRLLAGTRPEPFGYAGLIGKVARAVGAAHANGIVHRDIKPGNILVRDPTGEVPREPPDWDRMEPKVGDFGLAHLAGMETGLTRTGAVLGTPLYMAPEQVRGRSGEISPRTDVYALGAILYEGLTGRTPHSGETVTEIYGKIIGADPALPRLLNPAVPADLESIAMKALEKEPSARYPTAEQLADDLRRFRDGEPVEAKPVSQLGRWWRRVVRHRATVIPSAVAIILALLLAVGGWKVRRSAMDSRARDAELAARKFLDQARIALPGAVDLLYDPAAGREGIARRAEELLRLAEMAAEADPRLAEAQYLGGRAREILGEYGEAEIRYRRAIGLEPGFTPARYRLGRLLFLLAYVETLGSRASREASSPDRGRSRLEESAREIERARGLEDALEQETAAAIRAVADRDWERLNRIVSRAIERFRGSRGVEEFHWLAGIRSADVEEGLRHHGAALALRPNDAILLYSRGVARIHGSDWDGAINDYTEALKFRPRFLEAYSNRGLARRCKGDYEGAIADYDLALEIDPGRYEVWNNRGFVRKMMGDLDGAIEDCTKAIGLNGRYVEAYLNRGTAYRDRGARGDLEKAVEDFRKYQGLTPGDWPLRGEIEKLLKDCLRGSDGGGDY